MDNLIDYLPSFYTESDEVKNIQISIQNERNVLKTAVNELERQLFVLSATWALELWGRYLGIEDDKNESVENRRSRILTRLRGQGTTTKEMIKNICLSFTGGKVEIIEDSKNYTITIKFIDTKGTPGNLSYLDMSIEEIRPAHLIIRYEFSYLLISDIVKMTVADIENTSIDKFAF